MEENRTSTGLKCEIVTPEGLIHDGRAEMVVVPGEMGELGVLPRHAPLVSRTVVGEARVRRRTARLDHWPWAAATSRCSSIACFCW